MSLVTAVSPPNMSRIPGAFDPYVGNCGDGLFDALLICFLISIMFLVAGLILAGFAFFRLGFFFGLLEVFLGRGGGKGFWAEICFRRSFICRVAGLIVEGLLFLYVGC